MNDKNPWQQSAELLSSKYPGERIDFDPHPSKPLRGAEKEPCYVCVGKRRYAQGKDLKEAVKNAWEGKIYSKPSPKNAQKLEDLQF